jgi:hypothetical protein
MKLVMKIFAICMLTFLVGPTLVAAESDIVNTFLHFTDSPYEKTQTITEGDSIRVTTTAYGNYGAFEMQHLQLAGESTLFKSYLPGNYDSADRTYHFTRTFTINTAQLKTSPGTYIVAFTAVDENGEWETSTLTLIIKEKTDEIKPVVTIEHPEDQKTYSDYVKNFKYKAQDDNLDSCYYVLNTDAAVAMNCDDNVWYLIDISTIKGWNTLKVYAEDTYGNTGSDYVNFNVDIKDTDEDAPIVDIRFPTNDRIYTDYVNDFEFKAQDENLYTCWYELNGQDKVVTSCDNDVYEQVAISTRKGLNTLTVWASDTFGNIGSDAVLFTVSIDDKAPVVDILTPEAKLYTSKISDAIFTVEDDNLQVCWYKLNSRDSEQIDCDVNVVNEIHDLFTVEGMNTLTVWARDMYNNVGSDTVVFEMDYGYHDTDAPVVEILYPKNETYDEVLEFRFTVEDKFLDRCWYVLNGVRSRVVDCSTGLNIVSNPNVKQGQNTLTVYAEDLAENIGSDSVVFTIREDVDPNEPPVITVITPQNNGKYEDYIRFDVKVNEEADVVYSLDGAAFVAMDEVSNLRFNYDKLSPNLGWHKVEFCATDIEGLESCKTARFKMIEDDDKDDDCKSCNKIDWDSWYEELDQFYADKKAADDAKRRNAIHLTDDIIETIIEITFGEKVYYGVVAYVIALIILVSMLLFFVERKKTLTAKYRLY